MASELVRWLQSFFQGVAFSIVPLEFVRRGLTLVGSLIYDHPTDFQAAIDILRRRQVRPSALVSHVVDGLTELPSMLGSLIDHDVGGKTVIAIRGTA